MGARKTYDGAENVYKAAAMWVDCSLRTDDSLFTPGKPIWSSKWLGELHRRFLDRPDESGDSFLEKLQRQLEGSPAEVYQLMGEALYFYFLIVYARNSANEQRVINTVLGWSPTPVAISPDLVAGLTPGIANPGVAFHTYRPFQVGLIIEFTEQFKELESSERQNLLDDPWAFKNFLIAMRCRSQLLVNKQNTPRIQRQALLHLVHPDTFEGTVSVDHKKLIAEAKTFAHFVTEQTGDVDRSIQQIRQGLEAELGRDFDFYDPDIYRRWDSSQPSLWDEFVRQAQAYVDTGNLEKQEIDYKRVIGRKFAKAREAALAGRDNWADLLLERGFADNLIFSIQQAKFRDWLDQSSEGVLNALKVLWAEDDIPVAERVRAFSALFPPSQISGTGTRLTVVSVLLMGLDVERYPPFQITTFSNAYDRTGYDQPEKGADEAALYQHALGFLDRFLKEASQRGLTLRHRLDAQSVVWAIVRERVGPPPPPPPPPHEGLEAFAKELFLPVEFIENIETLLKDKKQVIFQGPPGTGKTYVAQKLAKHLAGWEKRVTLVQFHPSYAYEDFVQGFRPALVGDGQAGFELRDGPLLRAAERARQEPNADHFLVIDEINRGNLAKVFGELYFLLEYRDEAMNLQYSDKPFSLPDNLYIIGTMNTADRSIALVDLALRRRFYFVEFHPDDEPVRNVLHDWLAVKSPGMEWVADIVESANERMRDDRHAAIGPSYFMKEDLDKEAVERIWKHSVLPYIEECLFGDNEKIGEFDLKKLMAAESPLDCIADGLSRLLNIDPDDAVRRIQAEGGVSQADISNRWDTWHAAFKASGLKRKAFPLAPRPTLGELAKTRPAFIARVWDHLVTVIDGEAFEACGNKTDMGRKPNHYWIVNDGAESASVSVAQNDDA